MDNYLEELFFKEINKDDFKIAFEIGVRDLIDTKNVKILELSSLCI